MLMTQHLSWNYTTSSFHQYTTYQAKITPLSRTWWQDCLQIHSRRPVKWCSRSPRLAVWTKFWICTPIIPARKSVRIPWTISRPMSKWVGELWAARRWLCLFLMGTAPCFQIYTHNRLFKLSTIMPRKRNTARRFSTRPPTSISWAKNSATLIG